MTKNFLLILFLALLIGCNSGNSNKDDISEEISIVSAEELDNNASAFVDKPLKVTGLVTHVCKHGGQKMFITDETQNINLLVRVSQSIPEFDIALEGSTVEITGKMVATVTEEEESHEEGDCETESKMKAAEESKGTSTNITYHIEAASFREITDK
ncbi:MAG: OB-fold nucleic acid binding domain-containing protein [Bacteroidales bacterium]|nr:OB-fold nucleic acid binding domain-containing protein [Bacteroidales bacterium]